MGLLSFLTGDKVHESAGTINVNGKDCKYGRVTLCDLSAVAERIRDARIEALFRTQTRITDKEVFAKALAYVVAKDPTEQEVFETMTTQDGQAYILWRCISRFHPDVTLQDVQALSEKENNIGRMLLLKSELIDAEQEAGKPAENPTPRGGPSTGPKEPACFRPPSAGPQSTSGG